MCYICSRKITTTDAADTAKIKDQKKSFSTMKHVIHVSTLKEILETAEKGLNPEVPEDEFLFLEIAEIKSKIDEFANTKRHFYNLAITSEF